MKKLKLILPVLVLIFAIFVPGVSAIPSAHVVIAQLQTGGATSGTASQEFILLRNTSSTEINVSNWCIEYSSASNGVTFTQLACVTSGISTVELLVAPGGYISFATTQFIDAYDGFVPDFTFTAGLAATGGHVRIVDAGKSEVDRVGWGNALSPEGTAALAHSTGKLLSRGVSAQAVDTDDNVNDFSSQNLLQPFSSGLIEQEVIIDMCANLDGVQQAVPEGYEIKLDSIDCTVVVLPEDRQLIITEVYPNAPSYDAGLEYIELYNPNDQEITLSGYVLELGPSFTQKFILSLGSIQPGSYVSIGDGVSGLILPNTTAYVRLVTPAGSVVSETPSYLNPTEGTSWASVSGQWAYTNQPTPAASNLPYIAPVEDDAQTLPAVIEFEPCPTGKYRNPETNRCKTIDPIQSSSGLNICGEGQVRNPDTNRCRKVVTSTSTLSTCKDGQVRSATTNRCKSVASLDDELAPCKEGQERNPETNRCRKIQEILGATTDDLADVTDVPVSRIPGSLAWPAIGVVTLVISGYCVYEWRRELARLWRRKRMKQQPA